MAVTTFRRRSRSLRTAPSTGTGRSVPAGAPVRLPVAGELPAGLDGSFVQAVPHPVRGPASLVTGGVRLRDGAATVFTGMGGRPCPFGPVPRTIGEHAADPVRDDNGRWHTVVTMPGYDHAEHVVLDGLGRVVCARSFPLVGAPLVRTIAVTAHDVVVLALPVAYSRAADLVGVRDPYVWQGGRGARFGLIPRRSGRAPVWFEAGAGHAGQLAGARQETGRVVVDMVWHPGAPGDRPAAAPVVRLTLDTSRGEATMRPLTGPVFGVGTDPADPEVLFTASTDGLARYDLRGGGVRRLPLGSGGIAGRPVLVRAGRRPGERWLLVLVQRAGSRARELLVLDPAGLADGPVATVSVPEGPWPADRVAWVADRHG